MEKVNQKDDQIKLYIWETTCDYPTYKKITAIFLLT